MRWNVIVWECPSVFCVLLTRHPLAWFIYTQLNMPYTSNQPHPRNLYEHTHYAMSSIRRANLFKVWFNCLQFYVTFAHYKTNHETLTTHNSRMNTSHLLLKIIWANLYGSVITFWFQLSCHANVTSFLIDFLQSIANTKALTTSISLPVRWQGKHLLMDLTSHVSATGLNGRFLIYYRIEWNEWIIYLIHDICGIIAIGNH